MGQKIKNQLSQLGVIELVFKYVWTLNKSWKTSELCSWLSSDLIPQVFSEGMGSLPLERGGGLASRKIAERAQDSLK